MFNQLVTIIKVYLGETLVVLSSIASVAGFVALFLNNKAATIITLSFFCVFLIVIIVKLFGVLNKVVRNQTKNGYLNIATYCRYHTNDAKIINFGIQKHIICKQPVTNYYLHNFYWTGSVNPVFSSETMIFDSFIKGGNGDYDKVKFLFKKPLMYNDVGVVQLNLLLNDSDQKSSTHISNNVDAPINLLHYEVVLKHKSNQQNVPDARFLRKDNTSAVDLGYKLIKTIPFDHQTASYECTWYDLMVGFSYRLEWDR
jgi:hypothetical protein